MTDRQDKTELSFRFDSRMATLLGEQSVSNSVAALFELVKNCYDADATSATVIFHGQKKEKGKLALSSVEIKDNGVGMTFEDIKDKWMVVGTYAKEREIRSPKFGRRVAGEKGIGRFATQRLAKRVKIVSVPEMTRGRHTDYPKKKIIVVVDWEKYQPGTTFDSIKNEVHLVDKGNESNGLQIVLEGLKDEWSLDQIRDLNERLGWLVLPPELSKQSTEPFDAKIFTEGFAVERLEVKSSFLKKAPFAIDAQLKGEKLHYRIFDRGQLAKDSRQVGNEPLEFQGVCGDARFQMYFYPGDEPGEGKWGTYYKNVLGMAEFQDRMSKFCGIKIYNDGIRILPYGDPGNDWLGLNKRYAQRRASSFRNETVIGFLFLTRALNPEVKETTTREGIIQNQPFKDLQEFSVRSLILLRSYYEEVKNKEKKEKVTNLPAAVSDDTSVIRSEIGRLNSIPQDLKQDLTQRLNRIDRQVSQMEHVHEREMTNYVEEHYLHRNLSSVGISTIAFAHEIIRPISSIDVILLGLIDRLYKGKADKDEELKILSEIQTNVVSLLHWTSYVKDYAGYLASPKITERHEIELKPFIDQIFNSFDGLLRPSGIQVKNMVPSYVPKFKMNRADLESVIVNLLTNSVKAVQRSNKDRRIIQISVPDNQENLTIQFSDTGIGIPSSEVERIFEPLYSTYRGEDGRPKGLGMGLAITREILDQYGGTISVVKSEFENGATMLIRIPWKDLQDVRQNENVSK